MDLTNLNRITSQTAKNATNASITSGLQNKADALSEAPSEDELKKTLKDFESYFVEQVIKQVKETFIDNEKEKEDTTMGQYKDLYMDKCIEMVADELVDDIGENYSQQLYEQMKRNYNL